MMLRMEWHLASCALAAIGESGPGLEAGPHMDESDPWLADPESYQNIHDIITGRALPPELVAEARKQEMEFLKQLEAYTVVPISQCYDATSKKPIPCGWVDVNKGDEKSRMLQACCERDEAQQHAVVPIRDLLIYSTV
eukprot:1623115-Amphidinium_carterae.2